MTAVEADDVVTFAREVDMMLGDIGQRAGNVAANLGLVDKDDQERFATVWADVLAGRGSGLVTRLVDEYRDATAALRRRIRVLALLDGADDAALERVEETLTREDGR